LRGEIASPLPTVLHRDDGVALFYAGQLNGIHGDSGTGKSWVTLVAAAQQIRAGKHVVWIDLEDPNEATIVGRLLLLGLTAEQIRDHFHYINPKTAPNPSALALVHDVINTTSATLVVVDSLGEAFGLDGINEDKDNEVGPWIRTVLRPLADTGAAVVVIDHSTKAADNPMHPSGSKRKRAAITGASYLVTAPKPLDREHGGRLALTCAKDRHGHYRRGLVVANVEMAVYPDDGMTWHVWPPASTESERGAVDLFTARAAVVAVKNYIDETGEPPSGRVLQQAMKVKASTDAKRAGIEAAVDLGCLRVENGPRGARLYRYVRDVDVKNGGR
jgi:hypothetical protein